MAKGFKSGGRNFKKGEGGRKPLPPEIKVIANQTKPAIIEAYWKIINIHPDNIGDFKPETLLETGILRTVIDFVKTGKVDQIRHIWAECHGKPKESMELSTGEESSITFIVKGVAPSKKKK